MSETCGDGQLLTIIVSLSYVLVSTILNVSLLSRGSISSCFAGFTNQWRIALTSKLISAWGIINELLLDKFCY